MQMFRLKELPNEQQQFAEQEQEDEISNGDMCEDDTVVMECHDNANSKLEDEEEPESVTKTEASLPVSASEHPVVQDHAIFLVNSRAISKLELSSINKNTSSEVVILGVCEPKYPVRPKEARITM